MGEHVLAVCSALTFLTIPLPKSDRLRAFRGSILTDGEFAYEKASSGDDVRYRREYPTDFGGGPSCAHARKGTSGGP